MFTHTLPIRSGRWLRSAFTTASYLFIIGYIIIPQSSVSVSASQVTLFPNTSGKYTDDHSGSPVNNTNGLNGTHTTEV